MASGDMIAVWLVEAITTAVAVYGTVRCLRLQRFARDPRLMALAWFFGLFAAAILLNAAWQVQIGANASFGPGHQGAFNGTFEPRGPLDHGLLRPEGTEHANLWLTGHHALMLASFVVGVWAFGHRVRPQAQAILAPAVLGLVSDLVPAMLALEAGLTLYLAARAYLNHVEVRSPGAVQVALGFGLFFAGHLVFYVAHQPGLGHNPVGDILNLVGITLLVQVLPGKAE
jgi:hypothetical protein